MIYEALKACAKMSGSMWRVAKGDLTSEPGCKKRELYNLSSLDDLWTFFRSVRTLAKKQSLQIGSFKMQPLQK